MDVNGHGCLWWLFIGWWLVPIEAIFLCLAKILEQFVSVGGSSTPPPSSPHEDNFRPPSPTIVPSDSTPGTIESTPAPNAPQKKTETHRVAGTSFRLDDIKGLMGEGSAYTWTKKELIEEGRVDERVYKYDVYYGIAVLEPEPDNPHDPKAIKVLTSGVHIGYIKAGSCAHIHKVLREDRIEKIEVEIKGGDYKIVLEDYDDYSDKSTYSLERESIPISAVLTITLK